MTEEWSMIGVEERRIGGLEEQRSGVDETILEHHERRVAQQVWSSGGKERTHWQGRKRQGARVSRQPWLKKSNSFSDPGEGTSGTASSGRDRLRNIKFTEEENDVLVTKVLENYPKLYGDDASRTSSFEKKRIWRGILDSINCLGVSVRNVDTCKKRFADCKRFVRAKMSKQWRHAGRRPSMNVYYAEWEEKIKTIICPVVEGIPGLIDSSDPGSYECSGHWSPHENASPEAQLSPDELEPPDVQFYPEGQMSPEPKPQIDEEWPVFREQAAVNVKEERDMGVLEMQPVEDSPQHHRRFAPSPRWEAQAPEGHVLNDMDQLLYQSQEAFRRTLRRQLHAVRQELREFRRDHTERMDLLLTLHREHIMVEEQRNEILSQLVSTVNNLATKLNTRDVCRDRQHLQTPLTGTSANPGANTSTRTGTPAQSPPPYPSRQSPEEARHPCINRRRTLVIHRDPIANKRRK